MIRTASLIACLLLTGCASVTMNDNRTTRVRVTASCGQIQEVGARCLMAAAGQKATFDLPAEVILVNSWNPVTLVCEGELLGSTSQVLFPKPNIGLVGNLLLGGAPGAVIDTATGRGLNYDAHVHVHRRECLR